MSAERLADAAGRLAPIDLEELDARAALQRRTDRKYLLEAARLEELLGPLADHRALEVEGRRVASYESVYLDTPDLRCFEEHIAGRTPRFKVRSRLYADTQVCSFEVKVKQDEETIKEHLRYDPDDHGTLTSEARAFADATLERCGVEPPAELAPALTTAFGRATLAGDGERVTIDADLRLVRPDGAIARLGGDLLLVEVKTADGDGQADRVLGDAGVEEISLSKYRTGIALLTGRPGEASVARERFTIART